MKLTEYDRERIGRMDDAGEARQYIADVIGCSERTVYRELAKMRSRAAEAPIPVDDEEFGENDSEEDALAHSYTFFLSSSALVLVRGDGETHTIQREQIPYSQFSAVIDGDQQILGQLFEQTTPKTVIEAVSEGNVTVQDGEATYVNVETGERRTIPSGLHQRLISAAREQNPELIRALIRFTNNLFENPSHRAVEQLFDFLVASDIEIDSDGYIIAYKRVTADYKDCYTRTFDNSVGNVVSMPRNSVNEDPNETCSNGLHVCSKAYLPHYHGEVVLKVRIHPRDCVSVPMDYYSVDEHDQVKAKMRVCKYRVIADVTGEFNLE